MMVLQAPRTPRNTRVPGLTWSGRPQLMRTSLGQHAVRGLCVIIIDGLLLGVLGYMRVSSRTMSLVFGFAAVFVPFATFHFLDESRRLRTRRRVWEFDGKLCLRCGNTLSGDAATGECTECGLPYVLRETQHRWRRWADPLAFWPIPRPAARRAPEGRRNSHGSE